MGQPGGPPEMTVVLIALDVACNLDGRAIR